MSNLNEVEEVMGEAERFGVAAVMTRVATAACDAVAPESTQEQRNGFVICCAAMVISYAEDAGVPRAELLRQLEKDLEKVQSDQASNLAAERGSAN